MVATKKKASTTKTWRLKKKHHVCPNFQIKKSSSKFWGALPKTPKSYNDLIPGEFRVKNTHTHTHTHTLGAFVGSSLSGREVGV